MFCGHIDLRIPVGYIGLERQQGFGRCPHSCLGKGWPIPEWRRPDKHTAGTAETGRTPQKPPQSITYIAELHLGSNARKMGNKLILGGRGSMEEANERWIGKRGPQHTAEAWFFSFPSVASSKAAGANTTTFSAGKWLHRKRPFAAETPPGPEVGISRRALTLLPDEKELNSHSPNRFIYNIPQTIQVEKLKMQSSSNK